MIYEYIFVFRFWKSSCYPETATRGVPFRKVFLEISQNSQENTCAQSLFF